MLNSVVHPGPVDEERDVIAGVEHAEGDSDDDQRDEREGCSGESDDSDVEDERFFIACSLGELEEVERLHAAGAANVDAVDPEEGDTPLGAACRFGHIAVAQWLVAHGADISATNFVGETALHEACFHGSLPLVEWLLEQPGLKASPAALGRRNVYADTAKTSLNRPAASFCTFIMVKVHAMRCK